MIDWFLWERYFAGTITPDEQAKIEHWISANPDRQETVHRLQAAFRARSHREQRDWRRDEAIEAVLRRVRAGKAEPVVLTLPRRPLAHAESAAARVAHAIRQWFEGATELAAAMLLDAKEEPMSEDEIRALRERIQTHEREHP